MKETKELIREVFNSFWFGATSRWPVGTNIYEHEWDVLVILDACRVDALKSIENEYSWLNGTDEIWSVGSSSHEWMANTFRKEYLKDIRGTGLITSNPFASRVFDDRNHPPHDYTTLFDIASWNTVERQDFGSTEWCFGHSHEFEDSFSPPPAEHMTERGVIAGREQNLERLIIHYFQPHRPYIHNAVKDGTLSDINKYPYDSCRSGVITRSELWDRYLDNLRYVLDNVGVLLQNIDAEKVVISADHGELLGELGEFGHPEGVPHPKLKKVPWVTTTGKDNKTITPKNNIQINNRPVEEQLENLGYL
ncbi:MULTISPECIES: hypothetical protein [Halomicrobium]|uniref:Sulfatase N-terminal domain-containing protein n=2 Tax=Halomicrobium mukohataei TaxID=57705 RepID=C7P2L2_HALMD|nr:MULTISPECIES: hypothetical protein [Halomicrobium]ACV47334.1 conserved hypothetical protein [Halomicrobium mukohataei DSM 12286]QCD65802.1 hypothetical protein E5139_09220 [Halomicrobium mukohataei]QFR20607.1 hypothetical protein GBQ70_09215 [Halomicrobium sp. ZPS1]